jgi:uncharacterized protein YkwD
MAVSLLFWANNGKKAPVAGSSAGSFSLKIGPMRSPWLAFSTIKTAYGGNSEIGSAFTIRPLLLCNNGPFFGGTLMRAAAAILISLLLASCAAEAPIVEQPSMYNDMSVSGSKLDSQAAAVMISQYRQNNGLGTVVIDPELMRLAESQSQAMAAANKMDHEVRAPLGKRLSGAGYPATVAVENISAGYHTLAEAFSGWRDSPPHRANMLKSGVTKLGIAASRAPGTKYKVFWTMIMASTETR